MCEMAKRLEMQSKARPVYEVMPITTERSDVAVHRHCFSFCSDVIVTNGGGSNLPRPHLVIFYFFPSA